jgi:hypothetical protein
VSSHRQPTAVTAGTTHSIATQRRHSAAAVTAHADADTTVDAPVALHLSESKTTLARTTLQRLSREHGERAARPRVNLVVDHVLEALVVRRTEEDLRLHLHARVAVVHHLVAALLQAQLVQQLRDVLHRQRRERSRVALER